MTANGGAFSHLWTGDFNEYTVLGTSGWTREGVAWYGTEGAAGSMDVYRLYNPWQTAYAGLGNHLWTTSANEQRTLEGLGWLPEGAKGVGWYAVQGLAQ